MTNPIVQFTALNRKQGEPSHMFARLDDSIAPLSTDRIGWYIESEDGKMVDMLSSHGFTACGTVVAGERAYRAVCIRQRIGEQQATTHTGEWVIPETGDQPVIFNPTKPIKVTEPGTIILNPMIRATGNESCIKIDAPGCMILGGEIEAEANGLSIKDDATGLIVTGFRVNHTDRGYGIHHIVDHNLDQEQEFTCIHETFVGPSGHECSVRNTSKARNLVFVKSHAKNNRSKQAFRFAGKGGRYFNLYNSTLQDGGITVGNHGAHWAAHFRVERCHIFGDNDRNQPDTPGGDSLFGIKPNARDITLCSNRLDSDTNRRTITTPTNADAIDHERYPMAWDGGGGILVAHNTITSPRDDTAMRTGTPNGWDGSPITVENNRTNSKNINPTGEATPGVWTDFNGRELPANARAGATQKQYQASGTAPAK